MSATATDYQSLYEALLVEHQQLLHSYQQLSTGHQKAGEEITALRVSVSVLQQELEGLKKLIYGSRSERFVPSTPPSSIEAETAEATTTLVSKTTYTRTLKTQVASSVTIPTGRMKLPGHLPRERILIEPTEDTSGWVKIGEEITEELELIEAKLYVRQYVRPKYVRPDGSSIAIGALPARPIDKGIAGAGLLAQIAIDKYVDHLPLYRQQERFKRAGVQLPDSTMGGWMAAICTGIILWLYRALKKKVLQCNYLGADETPLKVLDKAKQGTTHRGYYWVYHSPQHRLVLFDYQQGRGKEGPEELLKDFQGYLQTDGYGVYDRFDQKEDITLLNCMAHARRMFIEAVNNDKQRAEYALERMQQLYGIERKAKEQALEAEGIKDLRQREAVPVLHALKEWLQEQHPQVVPQSPIGKAIAYSLDRWDKLCIYTQEGWLLIDNNGVENAIRPVALGRKNYLFAGSHEAAQRSAMLYSLLGTCKLHDINPFEWLKDVLAKAPSHPINRIEELLPHNWKPAPS